MKENQTEFDLQARPLFGARASVKPIPGTTWTLSVEDLGHLLRFDNAAGCNVTVPKDLREGFNCGLMRWGGAVAITYATGTINRTGLNSVSAVYGLATLLVGQNVGGNAAEVILKGDAA